MEMARKKGADNIRSELDRIELEGERLESLVNDVLGANALRDHTYAFARKLATRNPGPIHAGKPVTVAHLDQDLTTAYAMATRTMIGHFMDPARIAQEQNARITGT